MQINLQVPASEQFRAFYLFFIMLAMQLGVAVIGAPRIIFEAAGHDSWISILLAYLFIIVLVSIMIYILRQYENADLLGIQRDVFGSFISRVIGTIYILFFAGEIFAVLLTYIEIIQVFIFPHSSSFILGAMFLLLAIYASAGGLKVIIGVCFLFLFLSHWLIFLLPKPISEMEFLNFLPIMDRGIVDIIKGTYRTAYTFMGFEMLFFLYPFVRNKEKVRLPVILGISWSTIMVLLLTVISIGYFSGPQLERRIWPSLHLFKIQTTPFIERLDYIVVAEWMMVTVPKIILLLWGITYIAKRIYKFQTKYSLYFISGVILLLIPFFDTHFEIQHVIETVRMTGIWLVYVYPFILLPFVVIKVKMRNRKENKTT